MPNLYLRTFGILSQKHGGVLSNLVFCVILVNLTTKLRKACLSNNIYLWGFFSFLGENPIYKSAVTTVVNPKYEGK